MAISVNFLLLFQSCGMSLATYINFLPFKQSSRLGSFLYSNISVSPVFHQLIHFTSQKESGEANGISRDHDSQRDKIMLSGTVLHISVNVLDTRNVVRSERFALTVSGQNPV